MSVHEDCGYEQAAHADFQVNGKCVIDLPDEPDACEWCGRAIERDPDGRWYAVKGVERGYDPLACEASEDGLHATSNASTLTSVPLDPDEARELSREAQMIRTWTVKRDARIRRNYANGAGLREIARAVGLTHPAIRKIVDRGVGDDATGR